MTDRISILTKISSFFKSVQGILTSIGVVISFGFTVLAFISKHDAKVKTDAVTEIKKAVTDSISVVNSNTRQTRKDILYIFKFMDESDMRLKNAEGTIKALNASHIRTLENLVKGKDEVIEYQKEVIESQKEALKKFPETNPDIQKIK